MARNPHPLVAKLAVVRRSAGLSARAAARNAGLSEAVVKHWEDGKCDPALVPFERYVGTLGRRVFVGSEAEALLRQRLARLELERLPVTRVELKPVTPEQAAENRRVLAEAMGFDDDMPLAGGLRVAGRDAA